MISEFKVLNWRSCQRARFVFGRRNLFIGPNGAGKSNLLEAIGFLGILRSFRTVRPGELIHWDSSEAHLRGRWQTHESAPGTELEVAIYRSGVRRLQVNRQNENSGRDFIQHFYPVIFAPEDVDLINGMPGCRRRFFDMLASQLDDGYINVLHDYNAALKMRNTLLKQSRCIDPAKLEVYDNLLAFAGADLTIRRQNCIEKFNRTLARLTDDKTAQLKVIYIPQCANGAETALEIFARNRQRELEKRTTLSGCHLDEFHIFRGERAMRGFASNGQNRLAALHCKLSAALMVMQNRGAEKLIALVDDVTGELDEYNRKWLYQLLAPAGQMFFTFTEKPSGQFFDDAECIFFPVNS